MGESLDDLGRRDRKKRETRHAIESAAWRLFEDQGYDATTVDDIAAAADVASRTFFRYFELKEAVLFGSWRDDLREYVARLVERPPAEPPLVALEATLLSFTDRLESDRPLRLKRSQLATTSPNVGAYQRQVVRPAWQDAMSTAIATRLGVDADTDLRPTLYAGVASAALDAARTLWLAEAGTDLGDLLRDTFAELRSSAVVPAPAS